MSNPLGADIHVGEGALQTLESSAQAHRSSLQSAADSLHLLTSGASEAFGDGPSGQVLAQAFTARAQSGAESWEGVLTDAQGNLDEVIGVVKLGHHEITGQDIESAETITRSVSA